VDRALKTFGHGQFPTCYECIRPDLFFGGFDWTWLWNEISFGVRDAQYVLNLRLRMSSWCPSATFNNNGFDLALCEGRASIWIESHALDRGQRRTAACHTNYTTQALMCQLSLLRGVRSKKPSATFTK
jgi:hypothetical protein